jgi:hypothetical protein
VRARAHPVPGKGRSHLDRLDVALTTSSSSARPKRAPDLAKRVAALSLAIYDEVLELYD